MIVVSAPMSADIVRWHGATEDTTDGFFSSNVYGRIPALSIVVSISDAQDRTLYEDAGGLEVLGRVEGVSVVPKDRLLDDPGKVARAVRIAMRRLVGEPDS